MSTNTTKRDIRLEMADAIALLGDEYTATNVECDPGDTAIKITRQNNGKTMYITAYSNPDDTELMTYDENDEPASQHVYYNGSFDGLSPRLLADYIIDSL